MLCRLIARCVVYPSTRVLSPTVPLPAHFITRKSSRPRTFEIRTYSTMHSPPFVGAIDQGTSSTRFILFDVNGKIVLSHQEEFEQKYPEPGWVEQDPLLILKTVTSCIDNVYKQFEEKKVGQKSDIKAVGITNQRETTVLWDKETGKPLYNAIIWSDGRTKSTCDKLLEKCKGNKDVLRDKTGLPISTYFSGIKFRWMLDNVPEVKKRCDEGKALFGTIDTWLIWNLTGGVGKGIHVTDVTNASRTLMMDLKTCKWDPELCKFLEVPSNLLPEIKSSSEIYGELADGPLAGIPIAGDLGDQQGAVVGQGCFKVGEAKSTYGTGCFMLYNTGETIVHSDHGLLTTVAYQLGPKAKPVYALEGSVAVAGSAIKWLRDNLGIIQKASDMDELAATVPDTAGAYFVPAFSGLFAPYWKDNARGVLVGITQFVTKAHIARATLEAIAFQAKEVLDAMHNDAHTPLSTLKVDGGVTNSKLMLQIQADLLGIPVVQPKSIETTSFGTAYAAGLAVGVWKEIPEQEGAVEYKPTIGEEEREKRLASWKKAVERTLDWV
eukprot:Phypoly_transcript_05295.p1 GENE.Phypoly_transcript_05295~~Phypoly_transcript_05295.p1  ORF type:complete len:550 (+),score=73.52 Phypoly_transcript_05295:122-1771(+)